MRKLFLLGLKYRQRRNILLTRKEANPIVLKLLEKYKDKLKNPPKGLTYQDCYDVIMGKLKNVEYSKNIDKIKKNYRR